MFLLVLSCFFRWRKQIFQTLSRRDAEFFFFEHEMHERNESFRLFCVFRVHVILTTDIQNLTDFHHEHKQAYPFNLCNLCSKEKGKWKRMYLIYPIAGAVIFGQFISDKSVLICFFFFVSSQCYVSSHYSLWLIKLKQVSFSH